MGSGLKVTIFAEKTAKTIGNITIDGIRYHINKMKKENVIVRRNGKKGYWKIRKDILA